MRKIGSNQNFLEKNISVLMKLHFDILKCNFNEVETLHFDFPCQNAFSFRHVLLCFLI